MFSSTAMFNFDLIFGSFLTFWGQNGLILGVGIGLKNCFRIYSCSWATFIFYVSLNSGIWFWLNIGFIFDFLGPNRLFFGVGVEFENCFVVYSCSCSTFILYFSVNSGISFCLILGSFFGVLMGFFWGWSRVRQLFWGLLIYLSNFHFLCFYQFWLLNLT